MERVRLSDEQRRLLVTDTTASVVVQPSGAADPMLVVSQPVVRVITRGLPGPPGPAGPPGPTMTVPGLAGDVLFTNGSGLAVDTAAFSYSVAQRALTVSRVIGAVLDGGNF